MPTSRNKTQNNRYLSSVTNKLESYNLILKDAQDTVLRKKPTKTNLLRKTSSRLAENYIYIYHLPNSSNSLGEFVILPSYPESYTDTLNSTYQETNILARSAPLFAYSYSGPRSITVTLGLHRDMMTMLNSSTSNLKLEIGDDYVDGLLNRLQAMALPKYDHSSKMVNPPMAAVRFGNEFFIKGVVTGSVVTTSTLPLLPNGKYSLISILFTITEVDPYDAETVMNHGSMRGLNTSLERNLYRS